jgi:uncharacterized protein YbaR (Trm112 family)/SAM-dependent methyltransferase
MTSPLLLCPGCRVHHDGDLEVRTVERAGDLLVCECGRRFPIVDEVPILMADAGGYLRSEMATVVERELPAEVQALLVAQLADDAPYARLLEHLSIYLDAHWGDRAAPPPEDGGRHAPALPFAAAALAAKVRARAKERVGLAIELGCSAGRIVAELCAGADHVVGLDLHLGALRRARRLLAGEGLVYNRRLAGRHYRAVQVSAGELAVPADRVTWLCGDALDSVRQPRQLLGVLDGLCAHGGEILLSSPYAWQSDVVEEGGRLGGEDPARDVAELFARGEHLSAPYTIEDEDELSWTLRKDSRSSVSYRVHYLRVRKGERHAHLQRS